MARFSFVVLSLVIFVVGLFVMWNSVSWGMGAANAYLSRLGGGMDGAQFTIVLQEYINTYRWVGGILSLIGGLGLLKAVEVK